MTTTQSRSILCVGDSSGARYAQRALNATEGAEATLVEDREEVVARLGEDAFEAVCTGTSVGAMSGLEFAAVVRDMYPEIPILLVSTGEAVSPEAADAVGVTETVDINNVNSPSALGNRLASALDPDAGPTDERSRARLEALFERAADPILVADPDGTIRDVNEAACETLGYDRATLLEMHILDIEQKFNPADLDSLFGNLDVGETRTIEGRHQPADGSMHPVEVQVVLIEVQGQEQYIAQIRDISEREAALGELRAGGEVLTELHRISADRTRPVGERLTDILRLGREYLGMAGGFLARIEDRTQHVEYSVGDIEGIEVGVSRPLESAVCRHALDSTRPFVVSDTTEAGLTEDPGFKQLGVACYIGTTIEVEEQLYGTFCFVDTAARSSPFSEQERQFLDVLARVAGYELEQASQKDRIEQQTAYLESLLENVTDVVWITKPDKSVEFCSEAYEEIWGRPTDELLENPLAFLEAVHPEDRDRVAAALERQAEHPEAYEETFRVVQPDGEIRWIRDKAAGVYGPEGDLQQIVGIATDITPQHRRETLLGTLHETTRELLEADSREEVLNSVASTAAELFDGTAVVYQRAESEEALVPVVSHGPSVDDIESVSSIRPSEESLWRSYNRGRTMMVAGENGGTLPDIDAGSGRLYVLSLGQYGLLAVVTPVPDTFEAEVTEVAETLAITARTAIENVVRES